jgi:hypothetical protein
MTAGDQRKKADIPAKQQPKGLRVQIALSFRISYTFTEGIVRMFCNVEWISAAVGEVFVSFLKPQVCVVLTSITQLSSSFLPRRPTYPGGYRDFL